MSKEWPSREEWAEGRRTLFADMLENVECSTKLDDYATAEEVGSLRAALDAAWRDYGRRMKAAGRAMKANMVCGDYYTYQYRRREIREWQRDMSEGGLPDPCFARWIDDDIEFSVSWYDAELPFLIVLRDRYRAAWQAAVAAYRAEVEARPIDDEAWAKELKRRADIKDWRVSLKAL